MRPHPFKSDAGMRTSPWIIIGATVILLITVLVLAFQNIQRDRRHMNEVLQAKGVALTRAVEAGARSGMMGMRWGGAQLQRLLEETARMPEILYMAVLSEDGIALAHSDARRVGQPLHSDRPSPVLPQGVEENHTVITSADGHRAYEIQRTFRPTSPSWRSRQPSAGAGMWRHGPNSERLEGPAERQEAPRTIVVGMDVAPFEKMIAGYVRNTIVMSAVLLLMGFAGFVSLFWMNSYRAARRSLQDTSAFADQMVTHLPVGLIATGRDGRIAVFNSAAEAITGVQRQAALGRNPDHILPERLCGMQKVLDQGHTIREQEMACVFARDKIVPISLSATRIVNEEGQFVGNVLILRDLGELRRLQAEIRRQEKLAALGGLAAGVAHEIRNPLSSIKGLATYFAGKFSDGSQERKLALVMTQETDRLNRVISELLEFARPTDIKRRPTNINELLRHSMQLIAQDAAAKQITLHQHFQAGLCLARVDPDRLSQCLLNLYLNALQAMETGGSLTVASEAIDDEHLRIQVVDTGSGIAAEDVDRIFDPYFTTKAKGTGLGLAIVHKIIEAHGGHIQVESTPGKGTRFGLTLACQPDTTGDAHDSIQHPGGR
ncbi:MAG: hypothetical protein VR64_15810 [Desulfatitalea sp. BRH_c12]|nr:MAG: hypothetical protein VR64_15810 [Desulfatitalea sp. BRH_c12]